MRNARSAHAVVSTGNAIYALAGTGARGAVLEVERFDGRRWTAETTLPGGGLNAPAAAVLNRRIYVIGGFDEVGNTPTDRVHVYDPATRTWSTAAPLPRARGGHAAVVHRGKIHVLGGGTSVSTIADHSVYDPAADTWTSRARLPRARGSPAAVSFRGKIYAIGGRSGSVDFGNMDVYDPTTNRWSRGPRIPARGTAGAAVYRGAIYLFGGESQEQFRVLGDVLRLGPRARTWQRVSRMPTARNYARAVVRGGSVYVVGGNRRAGASHSGAGSAVVERFALPR
jgi:N-acetylneuraminic acid mutarotase